MTRTRSYWMLLNVTGWPMIKERPPEVLHGRETVHYDPTCFLTMFCRQQYLIRGKCFSNAMLWYILNCIDTPDTNLRNTLVHWRALGNARQCCTDHVLSDEFWCALMETTLLPRYYCKWRTSKLDIFECHYDVNINFRIDVRARFNMLDGTIARCYCSWH
jgi:hypothetical protein